MGSEDTTVKAKWSPQNLMISYMCANANTGSEIYNFTYTGNCKVIDDGNDNWRIKFLTSGTFTPSIDTTIDTFLVGGGGSGSCTYHGGGGAGGGYTITSKGIQLIAQTSYTITIGKGGEKCTSYTNGGKSGGSTKAFNLTAKGGKGGSNGATCRGYTIGNDGGSGGGSGRYYFDDGSCENHPPGNGGSDGSNGKGVYPGKGQGTTTREFGESTGTLYAGGGARNSEKSNGAGGSAPNTGGGGRGGSSSSQSVFSGIVVIRNER